LVTVTVDFVLPGWILRLCSYVWDRFTHIATHHTVWLRLVYTHVYGYIYGWLLLRFTRSLPPRLRLRWLPDLPFTHHTHYCVADYAFTLHTFTVTRLPAPAVACTHRHVHTRTRLRLVTVVAIRFDLHGFTVLGYGYHAHVTTVTVYVTFTVGYVTLIVVTRWLRYVVRLRLHTVSFTGYVHATFTHFTFTHTHGRIFARLHTLHSVTLVTVPAVWIYGLLRLRLRYVATLICWLPFYVYTVATVTF